MREKSWEEHKETRGERIEMAGDFSVIVDPLETTKE